MRKSLQLAAIAALTTCSLAANAFNNEPDGFRGVKWGSAPEESPALTQSAHAQNMLAAKSKQFGIKLNDFPVTTYVNKTDKLEFGGAELNVIVYQYYNNRFHSAVMAYSDSTLSGSGQSYARMHTIGAPPPRYYDAKQKVDRALKKYFGDPTDAPNLLAQIALKVSKYVYLGDQTKIESDCDKHGTSCSIVFTSVEVDTDYQNDMKQRVGERQAEAKAAIEQRAAEKRAKPDF